MRTMGFDSVSAQAPCVQVEELYSLDADSLQAFEWVDGGREFGPGVRCGER